MTTDTDHEDYDTILKQNTRRNSLVRQRSSTSLSRPSPSATAVITVAPMPSAMPSTSSSHCRRCSGDGSVPKPCPHCKASGKVRRTSSCVDCDAERNGCGNYNCRSCEGVGLVLSESDCWNCNGSGSGLRLSCGDCGGSGVCMVGDERRDSREGIRR